MLLCKAGKSSLSSWLQVVVQQHRQSIILHSSLVEKSKYVEYKPGNWTMTPTDSVCFYTYHSAQGNEACELVYSGSQIPFLQTGRRKKSSRCRATIKLRGVFTRKLGTYMWDRETKRGPCPPFKKVMSENCRCVQNPTAEYQWAIA